MLRGSSNGNRVKSQKTSSLHASGTCWSFKKWTYYEQSTSRMERIFKCKLSISSSQVSKGHPQVTIPECCLISCLIQSDALNINLKVPKFLNNLHELCTHTHTTTHTHRDTHTKRYSLDHSIVAAAFIPALHKSLPSFLGAPHRAEVCIVFASLSLFTCYLETQLLSIDLGEQVSRKWDSNPSNYINIDPNFISLFYLNFSSILSLILFKGFL